MFPYYQPFTNEWITFGVFFALIIVLLLISELARVKLNWSGDFNRKYVHVLVGLLVSISPFIFRNNLQPFTLAALFVVINYLALRSNQFKGMHSTKHTSYGTVYFPFAFMILCFGWWGRPITLITAILIMTIADTAAAVAGQRLHPVKKYTAWQETKSIAGSTAMFLTTFGIVFLSTILFSWYLRQMSFLSLITITGLAGFTAIIATISESVSIKGSDNLSVPIFSAIAFDLYLMNYAYGTLLPFLIWTLVSLVILVPACRGKSLSLDGALGAFIIGIIIFGAGGLKWITPLIIFFVVSSFLSVIDSPRAGKNKSNPRRDILQVLANGGIAAFVAVLFFYSHLENAYTIYLTAIAAATADTWATEIGLLSPRQPRHIISFKPVEKGTSGGITLLGLLGAILGAATIAVAGWGFGLPFLNTIIIAGIGIFGSLLDSIIGGTLQAHFTCSLCGKNTESRIHCGQPGILQAGWPWIDNNMVNLINTISGSLLAIVMLKYLI